MGAWEAVLVAIGGNAIALAVLGYLARSILQNQFARDTKAYEANLSATTQRAIDTFRADLQVRAVEHQVMFSQLHADRAKIIAELYRMLVEALWEAESLLSLMEWAGEPSKQEKFVTAQNKLADLYRYFDSRRIYLPTQVCDSLEAMCKQVRGLVLQFGVWTQFKDLEGDAHKRKMDSWQQAFDKFKTEAVPARVALEKEFRTLISPR